MLYLMRKQNLMAVKIIFSTTTIFFPLIIMLESTLQSYLLSLPILQITLIALNSIMTDSVLSSMISFSINYIISKSLITNNLIAFYQVASQDVKFNIDFDNYPLSSHKVKVMINSSLTKESRIKYAPLSTNNGKTGDKWSSNFNILIFK